MRPTIEAMDLSVFDSPIDNMKAKKVEWDHLDLALHFAILADIEVEASDITGASHRFHRDKKDLIELNDETMQITKVDVINIAAVL